MAQDLLILVFPAAVGGATLDFGGHSSWVSSRNPQYGHALYGVLTSGEARCWLFTPLALTSSATEVSPACLTDESVSRFPRECPLSVAGSQSHTAEPALKFTSRSGDAHAWRALRSGQNQPARPLLDRKQQRPWIRLLTLLGHRYSRFSPGDRDPMGAGCCPLTGASSARAGREPAGGEPQRAVCLMWECVWLRFRLPGRRGELLPGQRRPSREGRAVQLYSCHLFERIRGRRGAQRLESFFLGCVVSPRAAERSEFKS